MKYVLFTLFVAVPVLYALIGILDGRVYPSPEPSYCTSCHQSYKHQWDIFDDGNCTACHGGVEETTRIDLAHNRIIPGKYAWFALEFPPTERGMELIDENRCRRCHTIGDKGSKLASHLDYSIKRLIPEEIADAIDNPNEQMPNFNFTDNDTTNIVNALLFYMLEAHGTKYVEVVHISKGTSDEAYDRCGGCHRLLSKYGTYGTFTAAPFLSGLYNEYYPPIEGKRWDKELLSKWLGNPRSVKKNAVMPVIPLTKDEKSQIMELFEQ